eukprot:969706_1
MGSILILFLMLLSCVYGRDKPNTDEDMGTKMRQDVIYKMIVEEFMEKPWKKYIDELKKEKNANPSWRDQYSSDLIEVPVIVHVLYDRNEFIIGNEQIQSGFRALNDAFFDINYWDKDTELMKEYNYLAGNFSMQFKLSNIIYVDVTEFGETIYDDMDWSERDCVSVSPNYDQNHYLHFYLAPSIGIGGYGSASFPAPPMPLDECEYRNFGKATVTTGEQCLQHMFLFQYYPLEVFEKLNFIGDNGTLCLDLLSELPDAPLTEEACFKRRDNLVQSLLLDYDFSWEGIFDGSDCLELANKMCTNQEDPIQIIRFASIRFGTPEDDTRKLFSTGRKISQLVPHEVGHWVGLRHIFSDQDVCFHGDLVDDTITQEKKYSFICPDKEDTYTCNTTADMYNNIMDYSTCHDLKYQFTQGQVERGRYFFEDPTQLRHSFLDYQPKIVTKFINSIYFIIPNGYNNNNPCHTGDLFIELNINYGTQSQTEIYLCATYTMNPYVDMITDIKFTNTPFGADSVECGYGWERSDIDLNYGNFGKETYLCYKKENYGSFMKKPITNINLLLTNLEYTETKFKALG